MKINELRCKIIITFFLLLIYRLATYIPLPGVTFNDVLLQSPKGIIQIIYAFTVANFNRASIISLGSMPYISSSIFIQFIGFAFSLEETIVSRKINSITRRLTTVICLLQSPVYLFVMTTKFLPFFYMPKAYLFDISNYKTKAFFFFICMVLLTIGTLFCLWIGEKITDKGITNGISFIIMTAIIARFPEYIVMEVRKSLEVGDVGFILLFLEAVIWLIIIYFSVTIIQFLRKVPFQYVSYIRPKPIVLSMNKGNGYIPLKISTGGGMPIIFSEAILLLIKRLFPSGRNEKFKFFFEDVYVIWYNCMFIILIIALTFIYRSISLPINKMVYDLKRNEAYLPLVTPGKETLNQLSEIYFKMTCLWSILLAIIATFPTFMVKVGINRSLSIFYGGTSLLIIVGVMLELLQHVNIYLHTYDASIS